MKFTAVAVALSLVCSAFAAAPTTSECSSLAKFSGYRYPALKTQSKACANLHTACMQQMKTTTYIWNKSACVAAASCESPESIVQHARCKETNPQIAEQPNTPPLSFNIFKNIVGADCADIGDPMDQQDFVDFIYSTLETIKTDTWPNASEVIGWYKNINAWTKTGSMIPYKNFTDYLRYYKA